jgi:lysophospholipase L1-like esterase
VFRKILKGMYHNDPLLWRLAIEKFKREDRRKPPPENAVLFTGSSSIRFWDSLQRDMAPYPVINRGFGGSMLHQVVHYMDEIVFPYEPSAIFLYAGENDIAGLLVTRKHSAEEVSESFQQFCRQVFERLPDTPIHYISIKPAKSRRKYWPQMQHANRLIEDFCDTDPRLRYIDIVPAMHNDAGELRGELFSRDGVHLNAKGYAVWRQVIRPAVRDLVTQGRVAAANPHAGQAHS